LLSVEFLALLHGVLAGERGREGKREEKMERGDLKTHNVM
jgi:hypothetical protein